MVGVPDVMAMLAELAELTTLDERSAQSFKVRAYEKAARGVESAGVDVTELTKAELVALPGVGSSIAEKILELTATGHVAKLEELRAKYPPEFVRLAKIPGLGPKTLALLRDELGVECVEDLRRAIDQQRVRTLPGMGEVSEEKLAAAIERLGLHGKDRRTPISEALPVAESLVGELSALEGVARVAYCGSLRRFRETIGDVDIVVAATEEASPAVMDRLAAHPTVGEVVARGETKTSVITRSGLQVDVRVVRRDQWGAALLYFTGSKAHNVALRQRAMDRNMLLNEYGLFRGDGEEEVVVASRTEEEIYAALDLPLIPPPVREDGGEIAAAEEGGLGDLVMPTDVRGDLHCHSDRSGDGRAGLEEMVAAAAAAGYEYVAFTEHGEDLAINGSGRKEMLAHQRRIRSLQERHPEMSLLFACELNIGSDGSLDYDPDFRARFDWCVASVHSHFDLPSADQTRRLLAAVRDPSVDAIGHLTGRYLGRRPGIELDVEPVLQAMAEGGVALEVNGALERLDAPAAVVRRAVAVGVPLVVCTDAHHPSELVRMGYGVLTAQRGWAPRGSVMNTLPRDDLLRRIERRRSAARG